MTRGSSSRGTRRKAPKAAVDEIPEVFREMVAEDERRAQGSSSTNTAAERPLKRRRIAAATAASGEGAGQVRPNMMGSHTDDTRNGNDKGKGKAQAASLMDTQDEIMIDAGPQAGSESEVSQFEDEDEEESDADWEDVDLSTRRRLINHPECTESDVT